MDSFTLNELTVADSAVPACVSISRLFIDPKQTPASASMPASLTESNIFKTYQISMNYLKWLRSDQRAAIQRQVTTTEELYDCQAGLQVEMAPKLTSEGGTDLLTFADLPWIGSAKRCLEIFKTINDRRSKGQTSIVTFYLHMLQTKWRESVQEALKTPAYTSPDPSLLDRAATYSKGVGEIANWLRTKQDGWTTQHPLAVSDILKDFDDYLPTLIANFDETEKLLLTSMNSAPIINPLLIDPSLVNPLPIDPLLLDDSLFTYVE